MTVISRVPGAHVLGLGRTYVPSINISEPRRVRESTSSALELMQGARAGPPGAVPGAMHARHSVTSCRAGLWHGTYGMACLMRP